MWPKLHMWISLMDFTCGLDANLYSRPSANFLSVSLFKLIY